MPYGSGLLIRQALIHAAPWQRYLIGLAMVVGGILLVLIGHVAGALLALAGAVLVVRMLHYRFRRGHDRAAGAAPEVGDR
jgi:membrane protein implicated in regulation of membrane protease activity